MWLLLTGLLVGSSAARADDPAMEAGSDTPTVAADPATTDAILPPYAARVLGTEYTWRTGVLARRAWQEGAPYAFVGVLQRGGADAPPDVACPLTAGGPEGACVLATALVERLMAEVPLDRELSVEGRIIEVDGIRYVVLTAVRPPHG